MVGNWFRNMSISQVTWNFTNMSILQVTWNFTTMFGKGVELKMKSNLTTYRFETFVNWYYMSNLMHENNVDFGLLTAHKASGS